MPFPPRFPNVAFPPNTALYTRPFCCCPTFPTLSNPAITSCDSWAQRGLTCDVGGVRTPDQGTKCKALISLFRVIIKLGCTFGGNRVQVRCKTSVTLKLTPVKWVQIAYWRKWWRHRRFAALRFHDTFCFSTSFFTFLRSRKCALGYKLLYEL